MILVLMNTKPSMKYTFDSFNMWLKYSFEQYSSFSIVT